MTAEAIVERRRVATSRLADVNALVVRVEESINRRLFGEVDRPTCAAFLGRADQFSFLPIDVLPVPQGAFPNCGCGNHVKIGVKRCSLSWLHLCNS
jgi:hypothetical protein